MSVHDAESLDVYVDAQGKLWRCVGTCSEPTAYFEEVEPLPSGVHTYADKRRISGGVSGLMWNGFTRIWRKRTD